MLNIHKAISRNLLQVIIFQLSFIPIVNSEPPQKVISSFINTLEVENNQSLELVKIKKLNFFIKEKIFQELLNQDIVPYLQQKKLKPPSCFISYAWGNEEHEIWVEKFAQTLEKAGIKIFLDRWENNSGKILNTFIKRIENADWAIVIGTKLYLEKSSKESESSNSREPMLKSEAQLIEYFIGYNSYRNDRVIPVLLEGTSEESLPFMLRHKISSDFTNEKDYFQEILNLIHVLYSIDNRDEVFGNFYKKLKEYLSSVDNNITIFELKQYQEKLEKEELERKERVLCEVNAIKEKLLKEFSTTFRSVSLVQFPFVRSDFKLSASLLERPELIKKIEEKLAPDKGIITVAIVGIGGVGKTTLARQYAKEQKGNIVYEINAETKESLLTAFENLASFLSQSEEDKKILREIQETKNAIERAEKIVFFTQEKLRLQPDWLLIYDNVENFIDIQKYFPHDSVLWGTGKIIITTRNKNIQNNSPINYILPIGELTVDQKLALFMKIAQQGDNSSLVSNKEEIQQFLNEIPSFPLDISVAAYYIKGTNTSCKKYIENLNSHEKDISEFQEHILKEVGGYNKTRYKIITLSIQNLISANKDFRDLLLLISLLDSQNIPKDLLDQYKNTITTDKFIYNLKKYSLLIDEADKSSLNSIFSIHRSTQAIIKTYLVNSINLKTDKQILRLMGNTLETYIGKLNNEEDISRLKVCISHYEKLLKQNIPFLVKIKEVLKGHVGYAYSRLGDYVRANQLLTESLSNIEGSKAENQRHKAQMLGFLGAVCWELGDTKKSKILLEQSLVLYNKYTSENHVGRAKVLVSLGFVYGSFGDYEKGQELLIQGLELYEKYQPSNKAKIAWVLIHLGYICRISGNHEQAIKHFERSLVIYNDYYSYDHLWAASAFTGLGKVYRDLGYYNKAKELFERSLLISEKYFSEKNLDTAWTLVYLGQAYGKLGEYEKAINTITKSLEIHRKNQFEEESVRIAWVYLHLGNVYKDAKKYNIAGDFLEKCLLSYEKYYGKNHIYVGKVLKNIGENYLLQGDLESAENYLNEALKIKNKPFDQCMLLECLAKLNFEKSKKKENIDNKQKLKIFRNQAVQHLEQALNIAERFFPENSPHIIRIQLELKDIAGASLELVTNSV